MLKIELAAVSPSKQKREQIPVSVSDPEESLGLV